MRRIAVVVVIALIAPLLVAGADDKSSRDALKRLSGTWVVVGAEAKGKQLKKDELQLQWTFRADKKAVLADRKTGKESQYTYTIDSTKQPQAINIIYQGPAPALKNTKQFGIYKLEKNKLTICLSLPGATEKDRPKEFVTKEGSGFLMRLERTKDD